MPLKINHNNNNNNNNNNNLQSDVLFSEECESIAKVGCPEKGEKRTPDTITARVICHPLFVMLSSIILQTSQETNLYNISERLTGHAPGSLLAHFDPFCLFLLLDDCYDND